MKQQLSLSYGWGENQGKKQDWLNASHFAKCSSGQYITRKRTDRLRKRTERHQWSIVCSQGAPSNSSGSQYIKETKIYYTICPEIFLQTQITSFVFLWLNKSIKSSYVPKQICVSMQRTHTRLPPKVWNLSKPPLQLPFNAGKMHYLCAVKWTLCYSYKAKSLSSTLHFISCDPLASVLHYRLWQIVSGCWESWSAISGESYFLPWHRSDSKCFSSTVMLR